MATSQYDLGSAAYRKALRHHQKSAHNKGDKASWSAFRIQEKRYKARFPRPILDDVLDFTQIDPLETNGVSPAARPSDWGCGKGDISHIVPISLGEGNQSKAFIVPRIPGLVILPSFVSVEEQKRLIKSSLRNQACSPNETNLDAHYIIPPAGIWNEWEAHWHFKYSRGQNSLYDPIILPKGSSNQSRDRPSSPTRRVLVENAPASVNTLKTILSVPKPPPEPSPSLSPAPVSQLLYKMRWANIGRSYHWGTKSYDFSKKLGVFPPDVKAICKRAVRMVNWKEVWDGVNQDGQDWGDEGEDWDTWHDSYEPDAGIVNFYQWNDTLMGHVDRSELSSTTPLVSISLGNSAIFLIGGLTRDVEPLPILLRSGDVVIMSGPACRRAYHGVPRILEGTLPPHLQSATLSEPAETHYGETKHAMGEWAPFAKYMETTRININVRQVFPRGFEPSILSSEGGDSNGMP